jgi:hypothetical protein
VSDKDVTEFNVEEWLRTTKEIRRLKERNEILCAEKTHLEGIVVTLISLSLSAQGGNQGAKRTFE